MSSINCGETGLGVILRVCIPRVRVDSFGWSKGVSDRKMFHLSHLEFIFFGFLPCSQEILRWLLKATEHLL